MGTTHLVPRPYPSAEGAQPGRSDETRLRNIRIAYTARQHRFDPLVAVPFLCECDDDRCNELVRLTLTDYAVARDGCDYLAAPGHQIDGASIVRVKDGVWLYRTA